MHLVHRVQSARRFPKTPPISPATVVAAAAALQEGTGAPGIGAGARDLGVIRDSECDCAVGANWGSCPSVYVN